MLKGGRILTFRLLFSNQIAFGLTQQMIMGLTTPHLLTAMVAVLIKGSIIDNTVQREHWAHI